MGADIHLIVQIKSNFRDEWYTMYTPIANACINRDYRYFSMLVGVYRGEVFGKSCAKGLPAGLEMYMDENLMERTKDTNTWLGDHTFSWLTREELLKIYNKAVKVQRKVNPKFLELLKVVKTMADLENLRGQEKKTHIRVVFGFDS